MKSTYAQTVRRLLDTETMNSPNKFIVKCPTCSHKMEFANKSAAELHKQDLRRALISFVSRAIHKFLD